MLRGAGLVTLDDDGIDAVCDAVRTQRYRMICMNDSTDISDFDRMSRRLCEAFEAVFPEKSSYER